MLKRLLKFIKRALWVMLILVMVLVAFAYWFSHPGRGPQTSVNPEEKGYLELVDGTWVLHLKGSPYEMGYQHGALAREQVRRAMARVDNLLQEAQDEVGLPRFFSEFLLGSEYRLCLPYIPERYQREMEGLADGAGVDLQKLRWMLVVSELTERYCSAFAVFGKATGNGKLYHGRNFDWMMEAGLQEDAGLILYEPDGYIPFASAGYFGTVGVLSGMNMEGISISQIGAINKDGSFRGVPLMVMLRRILEEAKDLDKVTDIIANSKRTVGYNYVVADGKAMAARAYETCAHHCAIFTDNDPKETVEYAIPIENAVFRADEAMDQTVRSTQTCSKGYPNMPYGSESYDHRYKGMAKDIKEKYGKIDEKGALEILKNAAMRNTNLHSVLCSSTDREMWVAHAKGEEDAYKQPYVHYDLKKLFLRPEQRK
ncbi:MAG TPA: C45 family autoproteolytic acyltransferase/hydrolase [Candidatus Hydrogenedentes bacterium]|nr:C45 family autoproteolytic acyltransferase/hydrolase [Candidatus Hydrogenedentota bacterium]